MMAVAEATVAAARDLRLAAAVMTAVMTGAKSIILSACAEGIILSMPPNESMILSVPPADATRKNTGMAHQ
jgi:hypothetical protein